MVQFNGLSEQTLRLYDKAGLLSPMYRDTENNYRYYNIRQSVQLDMIQHMKTLGMSLKDIREQTTHFELDMFKTTLHRNLEELELRSREPMYQRKAIERTLKNYEWHKGAPPGGTTVLEYIPRKLMYMADSGVNPYDHDIDVYEKAPRNLKENLIANQLSPIYFCNVGAVTRREHLMEGGYYFTEILVLTGRGFIKDSLITEIPASTYLYIYCNGFEKEKEYTGYLAGGIRTEEYQMISDYICEVVMEVPTDMQEGSMFLRLQVPVSFRENNS